MLNRVATYSVTGMASTCLGAKDCLKNWLSPVTVHCRDLGTHPKIYRPADVSDPRDLNHEPTRRQRLRSVRRGSIVPLDDRIATFGAHRTNM